MIENSTCTILMGTEWLPYSCTTVLTYSRVFQGIPWHKNIWHFHSTMSPKSFGAFCVRRSFAEAQVLKSLLKSMNVILSVFQGAGWTSVLDHGLYAGWEWSIRFPVRQNQRPASEIYCYWGPVVRTEPKREGKWLGGWAWAVFWMLHDF